MLSSFHQINKTTTSDDITVAYPNNGIHILFLNQDWRLKSTPNTWIAFVTGSRMTTRKFAADCDIDIQRQLGKGMGGCALLEYRNLFMQG